MGKKIMERRMKCEKCGKNMVAEDPALINASIPPSRWVRCKCGHRDLEQLGEGYEDPKRWEERWEEANQ